MRSVKASGRKETSKSSNGFAYVGQQSNLRKLASSGYSEPRGDGSNSFYGGNQLNNSAEPASSFAAAAAVAAGAPSSTVNRMQQHSSIPSSSSVKTPAAHNRSIEYQPLAAGAATATSRGYPQTNQPQQQQTDEGSSWQSQSAARMFAEQRGSRTSEFSATDQAAQYSQILLQQPSTLLENMLHK